MEFLLHLLALMNPSLPSAQIPAPIVREWVIKEIAPPPPLQPGEEAAWWTAYPMTDVDGDGGVETYWIGESERGHFPNNHHTGFRVGFVGGWSRGQSAMLRNRTAMDTYISVSFPNKAYLRRPGGVTLALADTIRGGIGFYDLLTRQWLGSHSGQAGSGHGYRRAGDQTWDGYDDLFVWGISGNLLWEYLVCGSSYQILWQHSEPLGSFPAVMEPPDNALPTADLDHDGVPDLLVFYTHSVGAFEHHLHAMRGDDGTTIWEHVCTQQPTTPASSSAQDWNNDEYPDILLMIPPDHFEGVNGRDGALLWGLPNQDIVAGVPSGFGPGYIHSPIWLTRTAHDAMVVEGCIVILAQPIGSHQFHFLIAHVDPQTGSMREVEILPPTQSPWYPEPLQRIPTQGIRCIGDVDRDGIKEIAMPTIFPDDPTISDLVPSRMATLGLKTWFVAAEAQIGESLLGSISIPSAPHHRFNLLLSTGFDRDGGERLGAWKTHLVADALYAHTLGNSSYFGRLNGNGRGTAGFQIPNRPHLIGKTLYSKVAVLKPGAGGEVWTLSTLGQTRIVP